MLLLSLPQQRMQEWACPFDCNTFHRSSKINLKSENKKLFYKSNAYSNN